MRISVALALVTLAACGQVTNTPIDDAGIDTAATDAAAEIDGATAIDARLIDAQVIEHWTRIATVATPLDLGNNRGFMAVGLGSKIYIAPIYDSQTSIFHAFDTATLTLSGGLALPPGTQTDFQASGFGAIFVADADSLFLIGDSAVRYTPASDRWTPVAGYRVAGFERGESLGAWEGNNNTVFMIGGRDGSNTYQPTAIRRASDGLWLAEPGALPYTVSNGLAWAPPGDNKVYLAGGQNGDNNRNHLAVHSTGTAVWAVLADAPEDISRAVGMGHFTSGGVTRIWVATKQTLFFYNPSTASWDRSIDLPRQDDQVGVVMVAGVPHAVIGDSASADIYKLISIQ